MVATTVSFKMHDMMFSNNYACDIQNLEDLASIASYIASLQMRPT